MEIGCSILIFGTHLVVSRTEGERERDREKWAGWGGYSVIYLIILGSDILCNSLCLYASLILTIPSVKSKYLGLRDIEAERDVSPPHSYI